jgi:hypothetical protein
VTVAWQMPQLKMISGRARLSADDASLLGSTGAIEMV